MFIKIYNTVVAKLCRTHSDVKSYACLEGNASTTYEPEIKLLTRRSEIGGDVERMGKLELHAEF